MYIEPKIEIHKQRKNWFYQTSTKYNEDGTVYRKRPTNYGWLYKRLVLDPTTPREALVIAFILCIIFAIPILAV